MDSTEILKPLLDIGNRDGLGPKALLAEKKGPEVKCERRTFELIATCALDEFFMPGCEEYRISPIEDFRRCDPILVQRGNEMIVRLIE